MLLIQIDLEDRQGNRLLECLMGHAILFNGGIRIDHQNFGYIAGKQRTEYYQYYLKTYEFEELHSTLQFLPVEWIELLPAIETEHSDVSSALRIHGHSFKNWTIFSAS